MRKFYCFVAILIATVNISLSQHLSEIAMIDLNAPNIMEEYPFHSIEYMINPKLSAGVYFSIYISDILEKRIPKASDEETRQYIISIEDDQGNMIYATWADFLKSNVKLLPALILERSEKYAKDTITVRDKATKKSRKENLKTQKEILASLSKTVHLQIKKLSKNEIEKYFKKNSIIFPEEQSTYRWLVNAKVIKVYRINR